MSSKNRGTREKILEAARLLLEESQGQGVRMSDIAKQAGVTRQALYLHFKARADLLIAVTHYVDELKDVDQRLVPSRTAKSGEERLHAFIDAWGNYIPEIFPLAKAILAMSEQDEEADKAWRQRMLDMREECEAAVRALAVEGRLCRDHGPEEATDILWTLLSVRNWELFRHECGWSQQHYLETQHTMAQKLLVQEKP